MPNESDKFKILLEQLHSPPALLKSFSLTIIFLLSHLYSTSVSSCSTKVGVLHLSLASLAYNTLG